jgi:uncharacterized membrane protein
MTTDRRTLGQRWADLVTEFSGSWAFIFWFGAFTITWIVVNLPFGVTFDPYPFLFLNWLLTMVSTFQGPIILLSQNRQNEVDRERMNEVVLRLDEVQRSLRRLEMHAKAKGGTP